MSHRAGLVVGLQGVPADLDFEIDKDGISQRSVLRFAPDERVVMICGGCYSGNCGRMWRVGTGGAGMVPTKPCCERCERKFRNQRKPKKRYISALFGC